MPPLLALFAWPVVSVFLFQRWPLQLALLVTVVAGFLLLPVGRGIDLPVLPELNKDTIPALAALLMTAVLAAKADPAHVRPGFFTRHIAARGFMLLLVSGAFLTMLTNTDPLVFETRYLPGTRVYDGFSEVLSVLMMTLPLFLARKYLSRPEDHRMILMVLVYGGLAYSLLALYEIRMSPRLNSMFYGFFPHEWKQHIRAGGFRPLVFLGHGLILAIFFCFCILACFSLARIVKERRGFFLGAGVWLLGTLFLSNSLGALLIALLLLPVIWWLPVRMQILAAFVVAMTFLTYPVLRSSGFIPVDKVMEQVAKISEERAASFGTRLENEDRLLEKLSDRPYFGWGGWGRNRVFDETGRDLTVTDGYWIIRLSSGGWARYISEMGLICGPLVLLFLRRRREVIAPETAALGIIIAANLMDLIPNSALTPISMLLAGALWGRLEYQADPSASPEAAPGAPPVPEPDVALSPYTRQTTLIEHNRPYRR